MKLYKHYLPFIVGAITESLGVKNSKLDESFSLLIENHLTKKPTNVVDDDVGNSEANSNLTTVPSLSSSHKTVDLKNKKNLPISNIFSEIKAETIKNTRLNKRLSNSESSNSNKSFVVSDKPKDKRNVYKNKINKNLKKTNS